MASGVKYWILCVVLLPMVVTQTNDDSKCFAALKRFNKKEPDSKVAAEHLRDNCPDICKKSTGRFPHPWDCNAFITCYHDEAWVHWCQVGLAFNEKTEECDWPRNVDCDRSRPERLTEAPYVTTTLQSEFLKPKLPIPAKDELGQDQIAAYNFLDYKFDKEDLGIREDLCTAGSGDYAVPDCRFYLRCVGSHAFVSRCPGGYIFEPVQRHCGWSKERSKRSSTSSEYTLEDQLLAVARIVKNQTEELRRNLSTTIYNLVPVGAIVAYYREGNLPECWLRCDGAAFSSKMYPLLATALHPKTNTPDLQGKFLMGVRGEYPGRLVGQTGGAAVHVLRREEMPDHSHAVPSWVSASSPLASRAWNTGREFRLTEDSISNAQTGHYLPPVFDTVRNKMLSTHDDGGGLPHNNLPPFMAVSYIIRAC